MNVLYIPSTYEDGNEEKTTTAHDEHQYEHQYEHVNCCSNEIPNTINVELTPFTLNADPSCNRMSSYYQNIPEAKVLKIDIGNVSIQLQRKGTYCPNYENTSIIRLSKQSTNCVAPHCSIHHEDNKINY